MESTKRSFPTTAIKFDGKDGTATSGYLAKKLLKGDLKAQFVLTIEAWVYVDEFPSREDCESRPPESRNMILHLGQSAGGEHNWSLNYDGTVELGICAFIEPRKTSISIKKWTHFATVNDGSNWTVYKNGLQIGEPTPLKKGVHKETNRDILLVLGKCWPGSNTNKNLKKPHLFFNGLLAEVRVWNKVRTSTEILEHNGRQLNGDDDGLVVYYRDIVKNQLWDYSKEHVPPTSSHPDVEGGISSMSVTIEYSVSNHLEALYEGQEVYFILGGGGGGGMPIDAGAGTAMTTARLQKKIGFTSPNASQQLWTFTDGYIVHKSNGLVLDAADANAVTLQVKDPTKASQKWTIEGDNGQLLIANAGLYLIAEMPSNRGQNFYNPGSMLLLENPRRRRGGRWNEWYVLAPSLRRPIIYTTESRALTVANLGPSPTGSGYPQELDFRDDRYLWYLDSSGRLVNDATLAALGYSGKRGQHRLYDLKQSDVQPSSSRQALWNSNAEQNRIVLKSNPSMGLAAYPHSRRDGATLVDSGGDQNFVLGNPVATWGNPSGAGFLDIETTADGVTFAVTHDNKLVYFSGDSWQPMPGKVSDALNIIAGSSRSVFYRAKSGQVFQMIASPDVEKFWHHLVSVKLKEVVAGASGAVWGISVDDKIVRWEGGNDWTVITPSWQRSTGHLIHLSVASNEHVWGTNHDREVWFYNGTEWTKKQGEFYSVSVGGDYTVRAVNPAGQIFEYQGFARDSWVRIPGILKMVTVGSTNVTWGLGAAGEPYHRRVASPDSQSHRHMQTLGVDSGNKQYETALLNAHMSDFAYKTEADARTGLRSYSPPFEMKQWFDESTTDTQGYLAYSAKTKTVVLAFRGTEASSLTDIFIDLWQTQRTIPSLGPKIKVVKGFSDAFTSIMDDVKNAILNLMKTIDVNTIQHFYITGHSLGGALATLFGLHVAQVLKAEYNFNKPEIIQVITIAAPPTGNSDWQNYFQSQSGIFRALSYQNPNDRVTTGKWGIFDFSKWDYQQASTVITLSNQASFPTAHGLESYITTLEKLASEYLVHPLRSLVIHVKTGIGVAPWWKFDQPGTDRTVTFEIGDFEAGKTVSQVLEPQYFFDEVAGVSLTKSATSPGTSQINIDGISALTREDLKEYKIKIEDSGGGLYFFSKDNWGFAGLKIFANHEKIYDKHGNWLMGPDYASVRKDMI